jgi:hypothetical protein
MKPQGHAIASGIISLIVWYAFRSFPAAVASFLTGTLIDLDHYIDFFANHHFTLSLKKVYEASEASDFTKLYLVCHSYEMVIILWALIAVFSLGAVWKGIAIGLTQHMILDQLTNPMTFSGYFLIYRAVNGFKKECAQIEKECIK